MRHVISAILCLWATVSFAQIEDTALVCVVYKAKYVEYEGQAQKEECDQVLNIGQHYSKYFCGQKSATQREALSYLTKCSTGHRKFTIYKNYPQEGKLIYTEFVGSNKFKYEEEMEIIDWQLLEGDSTVAGYRCNKATGTLHGNKWTAWYTLDLPYSDGPWKLSGLPGLIMAASDASGLFTYECIEISTSTNPPLKVNVNLFQQCTPKELQEQRTLYWKDQANYVAQSAGIPHLDMNKATGDMSQKSLKAVFEEEY